MFQENRLTDQENENSNVEWLDYYSFPLEEEVNSSNLKSTTAGNAYTVGLSNNTITTVNGGTGGTNISTSELRHNLHDWLNEENCPDFGRKWNQQPVQQLVEKLHQLELFCQSSTPTPPSTPKLELPVYYREASPPPQVNETFDESTSDYESSSELGSSYNSLPSINWSFTGDITTQSYET